MRRQEASPGFWCCGVRTRKWALIWAEGVHFQNRWVPPRSLLQLQRTEPAEIVRWFDCPWLTWPPGLNPEILAQPEGCLFFRDGFDERRFPYKAHTSDPLRLVGAAASTAPAEQFTAEDSASWNPPAFHHSTHCLPILWPLEECPPSRSPGLLWGRQGKVLL